jgi:Na+/H+ antiporter NhaD/arsenite permease-like protein
MNHWSEIVASTLSISVFALIISEKTHLMIAGLLGALLLVLLNILSLEEAIAYISRSHATLALFFGVMVMVRVFQPTRIFEYLATQIVILAKGQGKRLLLGIVAITTPVCAVLPNLTFHGIFFPRRDRLTVPSPKAYSPVTDYH